MEYKNWIINYRQYSKGRRSLKSIIITAVNQAEAIIIFNTALEFMRMEEPERYNTAKLMYVFEEA